MRRLLSVTLTLALAAAARGQCQYSVQEIAPYLCSDGWTESYTGLGLNDLGAWCGYRRRCFPLDGYLPVVSLLHSSPQLLPMPLGASEDGAKANAVNNDGVVVGFMYTGSSGQYSQGVIWWPDGVVELIPPLPGSNISPATDINNAGVIVGYSGGKPYVLEDGVMTIIPNGGLGTGHAWRIADSGHVTGTLGNENLNARAFRWKDGLLELLEPLPGYPVSVSRDVNSNGEVVGYSKTVISPTVQRPTIWIEQQPIELPMPPGYTTGAAGGINDAGIIEGSASGPGLSSTQLLWVDGVVYKMSDLLVPGSPSMTNVVAINAFGQLLNGGGPRIATPLIVAPADLNGDCAVDGDDLGVLLSSWGAPDFDPRCDFNGDGAVDGFDLGTLLGEWTAVK